MSAAVRCRVGDIALVVSAKNADNIGMLVEVLGPATGQPFKVAAEGMQWQVRCAGGVKGLCYQYKDGRVVALSEGPVPDAYLRPLRGGPKPALEAQQSPGRCLSTAA